MSLSQFDPHRSAILGELKDVLAPRQGFLYDVLRYHLGWTDRIGKPEDIAAPAHFPSLLALVVCEALCGDFGPSLPAGAAIELVHNFTLVHGDVQSNRAAPNDRPSVWWIWGPAQAINAGDGLHALGRTTIMRLAQRGAPADRVLRAVESLDRACLTLCEGQYMDLEFQDQLVVTTAAYYDMISRKTGALTACSAEMGALAAGADGGVCAAFREIGNRLGMAWQIRLDNADLWGQKDDGMTPGNLLNKKKSLPLIHSIDNAPVAVKRELGAIYAKRVLQPEDVSRVIAILDEAGARQFAEDKARDLVQEALEALGATGLPEASKSALVHLADWVLEGRDSG